MARKSKSEATSKGRGGKSIYAKALCSCGDGRSVVNCTVPRKHNVGQSSGEDLRDLMQLLSMGKGGGAKVDVDSEGNIVWRKPAPAETSYGGGVGRIGRIDEDKPCCFNQGDVFNKLSFSRSRTHQVVNNS